MRRIERTKAFKRDYQRVIAAPKHRDLDNLLPAVVALLAADAPLPAQYVDHPLRGAWKDFRDFLVKPDLVFIYRKVGGDLMQLVRLGSHTELGFWFRRTGIAYRSGNDVVGIDRREMVERKGIEPSTFALRTRRSPS